MSSSHSSGMSMNLDVSDSSHVFLGSFDKSIVSSQDLFVFHVKSMMFHYSEKLVDHSMGVYSGMSNDRMELINHSVVSNKVVDFIVLHVHMTF